MARVQVVERLKRRSKPRRQQCGRAFVQRSHDPILRFERGAIRRRPVGPFFNDRVERFGRDDAEGATAAADEPADVGEAVGDCVDVQNHERGRTRSAAASRTPSRT